MGHYIDKDALVAEIESLIDEIYAGRPFDSLSSEQQTALWYVKSIMSSVVSLEGKEVEEPVSEELQYEIANLGKRYPEVSFAKLSRIAVHMARWQKQHMMKDAIECKIGSSFVNEFGGFTQFVNTKLPLVTFGRKVKIITIMEDN